MNTHSGWILAVLVFALFPTRSLVAQREAPVVLVGPPMLDLDRDGRGEVLTSAAFESLPGAVGAGVVSILYGSPQGPGAQRVTILQQGTPLAGDVPEAFDRFGAALATGDFNGDQRPDVVVGVPGESVDGAGFAGQIHVFYGLPAGGLASAQIWNQNAPGVEDAAEGADLFGSALAAGDFDRDGHDDLAISAPGESLSSSNGQFLAAAGAVHVFYGSPSGLQPRATERSYFTQPPAPAANAYFGESLAALTASGASPDTILLLIGAPNATVAGKNRAGQVTALLGEPGVGLGILGARSIHQNTPGVADQAETDDFFGQVLYAPGTPCRGNGGAFGVRVYFGTPREDLGSTANAGLIQGLCLDSLARVLRDTPVRQSPAPQAEAQFGSCIALLRTAGPELDVVIAGAPLARNQNRFSGGVFLFTLDPGGRLARHDRLFRNSPGMPGITIDANLFGASCGIYMERPDSHRVVIGSPEAKIDQVPYAGEMLMSYVRDLGATTAIELYFMTEDIDRPRQKRAGGPEAQDRFGTPIRGSLEFPPGAFD